MLRTHGRYTYSNITTRPDYNWPGGRRLAVYVAVNLEQFSYGEGKGAGIAPPEQSNTPSIFSWRDYGNRVGIAAVRALRRTGYSHRGPDEHRHL